MYHMKVCLGLASAAQMMAVGMADSLEERQGEILALGGNSFGTFLVIVGGALLMAAAGNQAAAERRAIKKEVDAVAEMSEEIDNTLMAQERITSANCLLTNRAAAPTLKVTATNVVDTNKLAVEEVRNALNSMIMFARVEQLKC